MADQAFTVADFFRLGNETADRESALRIKEAEALASSKEQRKEIGKQINAYEKQGEEIAK